MIGAESVETSERENSERQHGRDYTSEGDRREITLLSLPTTSGLRVDKQGLSRGHEVRTESRPQAQGAGAVTTQ